MKTELRMTHHGCSAERRHRFNPSGNNQSWVDPAAPGAARLGGEPRRIDGNRPHRAGARRIWRHTDPIAQRYRTDGASDDRRRRRGEDPQSGYKADQSSLGKLTEPLLNTPFTVETVTRQLMDDQGVTTLRDALRNVPGISLASGEGSSQGDALTIRGFTARNDIFLDGMRDFGSYYRDPFYLQNIQVLKGPASILFGRGSTGGIVEQDSKLPTLSPFANGTFMFGTDGQNGRRQMSISRSPISARGRPCGSM